MTAPHTPPADAQADPIGMPLDDITIGWQIDFFTDYLAPVSPAVARAIAGQFPGCPDSIALFAVTGLIGPTAVADTNEYARREHGWAKTRLLALAAYLETAS